jgi:hypothetical protein
VSESQAEPPSPEAEPAPASAAQLVDELRRANVADLLVHTSSLLGSLAYGKLAPEVKDLDQARLAIDALKALVPVLPEERSHELKQLVANLQLAYADAASAE